MISDDYLFQQGKRLSGLLLDSDSVNLGEEKGHCKSFFKKVGDMLKNTGSSSCEDINPPHFVGHNKSGSIQNLHSTQQCVVPLRTRKKSDSTLATQSCSDINVF